MPDNPMDDIKRTRSWNLGARFSSRSRLALLALNIIIYGFLIHWAVRNIQFTELVRSFARIPVWAVLLSLTLNFVALLLYGARMRWLLFRDFSVSFATINVGYAYNTILPFRLGDLVKVYMCARIFSIRISQIVAATVAEKVFDLSALLVLSGTVIAFSASGLIGVSAILPLAVMMVAGFTGLAVARVYLGTIVRLLPKRSAARRGVVDLFRHSSRYQLGRILALTAAIWIVNTVTFYVAFNTYLPGTSGGPLDAAAMLAITALTIALPSAPAGLGLFEAGMVAFLNHAHHIPFAEALAVATVLHLVITVPQIFIAMGMVAYLRPRPNPGGSAVEVGHPRAAD